MFLISGSSSHSFLSTAVVQDRHSSVIQNEILIGIEGRILYAINDCRHPHQQLIFRTKLNTVALAYRIWRPFHTSFTSLILIYLSALSFSLLDFNILPDLHHANRLYRFKSR